jgi:bacillithiol system protein YtxJ
MNRWIQITQLEQIEEIKSNTGLSLIFKHSTTCPVSMMSKKTFEWEVDQIPPTVSLYFLDLLRYRSLSNEIANEFQVKHESPQVILIEAGRVIHKASHSEISASAIASYASLSALK